MAQVADSHWKNFENKQKLTSQQEKAVGTAIEGAATIMAGAASGAGAAQQYDVERQRMMDEQMLDEEEKRKAREMERRDMAMQGLQRSYAGINRAQGLAAQGIGSRPSTPPQRGATPPPAPQGAMQPAAQATPAPAATPAMRGGMNPAAFQSLVKANPMGTTTMGVRR